MLAVSVNPADWRSMRAKPLFSGHSRVAAAKQRILGVDIAGEWRPVLDFSVAAKALACGFATLVNPTTAAVPPLGTRPRQREGRRGLAVRIHHRQRVLIKPLPSELIEAGKERPHIDRRYPFAEIPAAIAYLQPLPQTR